MVNSCLNWIQVERWYCSPGGLGALQAIGVKVYLQDPLTDKIFEPDCFFGRHFECLHSIEIPSPLLPGMTIEISCDVNNPFIGPNGAVYVNSFHLLSFLHSLCSRHFLDKKELLKRWKNFWKKGWSNLQHSFLKKLELIFEIAKVQVRQEELLGHFKQLLVLSWREVKKKHNLLEISERVLHRIWFYCWSDSIRKQTQILKSGIHWWRIIWCNIKRRQRFFLCDMKWSECDPFLFFLQFRFEWFKWPKNMVFLL